MKHKHWPITISVLSFILCLAFACTAWAAPTVILDGQQLSFDVPPSIEDGRTLVPLRAIFEAMGATVTWDQDTQTAIAVRGDTTVILQIGNTTAVINQQEKTLDVPAKIVDDRTLAPLRFVGEAFGGTVEWNEATQLITITSIPTSGTPPPTDNETIVHFIDVGQADSIYIELPDENDILIDAGNRADGRLVVDYLKYHGVDDIELLIATHPHEDHIGGLPDVYNAFIVEQTIDSGYLTDTQTSSKFQAAATAEGNYIADNYQYFTYGTVALDILTGNQTWGSNANDYSVVCRLDCGDIEFLFTGDAETPVEDILTGDLSAEILKVGHHGSTSSSSQSFLDKVDPEVAIISVGEGNTYGHPHQETLDKLENIGATIYRTDLNGTVVVTTDGTTYEVISDKNEKLSPIQQPVGTTPTFPGYVGSSKSDKYHSLDCRYVDQINPENLVFFETKAEAEAAGYVPCGVCKP